MVAFRGRFWRRLNRSARDRRGAVALLFALALVPLTIAVALATDFSFYIQARSQLNLAADAAAMHAVRVASQAYANGTATNNSDAAQVGKLAGKQWFAAQLGSLNSASVSADNVAVNVNYNASPPGFTATVSYSGTVATHLGKFIVPSWNIADGATAVLEGAFVEVLMMIDNSSSMLIASTVPGMVTLEQATPCSMESANAGDPMASYSWDYPTGYGYPGLDTGYVNGTSLHYLIPQSSMPVVKPTNYCDGGYDGDLSACFYIPLYYNASPPSTIQYINPNTGLCTNGGGSNEGTQVQNIPQAPCAFACHFDANFNDYYGLARKNGVQVRLDIVHQAVADVIQSLQNNQETAGQFTVGIYEFNSTLQVDYPTGGGGEAGTDLGAALTIAQNSIPPVTPANSMLPNTNFPAAAATLAASLSQSGDGSSANSPLKYMFIVTDGMNDTSVNGQQTLAPITNGSDEQVCQKFKDLGITVFVLYTPYLPIPTPTYTNPDGIKQYVQGDSASPIYQALQACASSPSDFVEAKNSSEISADMQQLLASALNSASRISK